MNECPSVLPPFDRKFQFCIIMLVMFVGLVGSVRNMRLVVFFQMKLRVDRLEPISELK